MNSTAEKLNTLYLQDPVGKGNINVYFEKVTPKLAQKWLDNNHSNNRAINKRAVASYVSQMEKGLWHPASGENIKISESGKLIDGQHRLSAVVDWGKPCWLMVISGVPEKAITAIDDGMKRNLKDALTINGVKIKGRLSSLAGAVKILYILHQSFSTSKNFNSARAKRMSTTEQIDFHGKLPKFNEVCEHYAVTFQYNKTEQYLPAGVALALYWLFKEFDEDITFSLIKSLETGIPFDGLADKSPVFYMCRKIQKNKELGISMRSDEYINMFTWTWLNMRMGTRVHRMPMNFEWPFATHYILGPEFKERNDVKAKLIRL